MSVTHRHTHATERHTLITWVKMKSLCIAEILIPAFYEQWKPDAN